MTQSGRATSPVSSLATVWIGPCQKPVKRGAILCPVASVATIEAGSKWSPLEPHLPGSWPQGCCQKLVFLSITWSLLHSCLLPLSLNTLKWHMQQTSLGRLSSTWFWLLFYNKQTWFIFSYLLQAYNFDNIYKRLKLVPINKLYLCFTWLQTVLSTFVNL